MHDPADDPAIVYPLDAAHIPRQIRPNSSPLLVAQPKQILAHDPDPLPKTNQDRILRAQMLMSFDPNLLPDDVFALKLDETYRGAGRHLLRLIQIGKTKFSGGGY